MEFQPFNWMQFDEGTDQPSAYGALGSQLGNAINGRVSAAQRKPSHATAPGHTTSTPFEGGPEEHGSLLARRKPAFPDMSGALGMNDMMM